MPEPTITPPTITEPPKPVEIKLASEQQVKESLATLDKIEKEVIEKFSGRINMNPFMWVGKHICPLRDILTQPGCPETVVAKVKALKVEEPHLANNYTSPVDRGVRHHPTDITRIDFNSGIKFTPEEQKLLQEHEVQQLLEKQKKLGQPQISSTVKQ
jgi:hypothetical protein